LLLPSGENPSKYGGENWDAPFIRMRIGKENHASYVVSINSSIKNHYSRLESPRGGGKRVVGRMDEDDLGKVTGPKENAVIDLTYLPV
jgi:hypothetical protein